MTEEKQYLGMVWHDGRLIYNCAPREHQTIHLAPAQIIPLLRCLETHLESSSLSIPPTDLSSWLEGYQDGFSASHLLKTEVCNRCSSQSSEEKPLSQTGQTSSQSSGLSTQNLSSSSPNSVSKDARTDSTSETGSETVAQGTQTELPEHETLRSLDGVIHQGVKMDTQPDTLSEQARLDLLKFSVQMVMDEYPSNQINPQTMEGFYSFLCRLARGEDVSPDGSSHQENNDDTLKDCTETAEKTVAKPAFELSVEELLQINRGFIPEALKIRALNELKRRSGEGKASS